MSYPFLKQRKYLFSTVIILFSLLSVDTVYGQFVGDYASENWTFSSEGANGVTADGTIDLTNMPIGFTLTGNNDGVYGAPSIYKVDISESNTLKVRWSYETEDGPSYDRGGYMLNGSFFTLTDPDGASTQNGEFEVAVDAGDVFAFVVDGTDACCGSGHLTVDAFSIQDNVVPAIDQISDIVLAVDAGLIDIDLTGIYSGILEPDQEITITAISSNTAVIPNPTIVYTSPDQLGGLSFTPVSGVYGNATITVNIKDNGGTANGSVDNFDMTFAVEVKGNYAPTIDQVSDVEVQLNEETDIFLDGISAGNGEGGQVVIVTAESSNNSLIANENIVVDYSNPDTGGTITILPNANVSGSTDITVTVSDDGGNDNNGTDEVQMVFEFVVLPNSAPFIDEIDDLNLFTNESLQTIDLTGIYDFDDTQNLSIDVSSSNVELIPTPSVTYASPGNTGEMNFTPVADQFGTAMITVTINDDAGTSNGGVDRISVVFDVNVYGNYSPTITSLPNIKMTANQPAQELFLTGISPGVIDNGEELTLSVSSSNENVISSDGIFLEYTSPNSDATLSLTPVVDAVGETTITVLVSDDGGTANGGIETVEETFVVKVVGNQKPTISPVEDQYIDINQVDYILGLFGISDGEEESFQEVSITAVSNNVDLIPNPVVQYNSGDDSGTLTFEPVVGEVGVAIITLMVTDDGLALTEEGNSVTTTFIINVSGNQTPTLDALDDLYMEINDSETIDLDGISDGFNNSQNLTVTVASSNTDLVPIPTVSYSPNDEDGSIEIVPVEDGYGTSEITVTVTDDGGTDNGGIDTFSQSFLVYVGGSQPPALNFDDLPETVYLNMGSLNEFLTFEVYDDYDQIVSLTVEADNDLFSGDLELNYLLGSFYGELVINPVSGQSGTVFVTATDDGGTENGGVDTAVESFEVKVNTAVATYNAILEKYEGAYIYEQPFTVSENGMVLIDSYSSDFDVTISLYENSFNLGDQVENLLVEESYEGGGESGYPRILYELEADKQYVLVTRNNDNAVGTFINKIGVANGEVGLGFTPYMDPVADVDGFEDMSVTVEMNSLSDGNGNSNNLFFTAISDVEEAVSEFNFVNNLDGSASLEIVPEKDVNGQFEITIRTSTEGGSFVEQSFNLDLQSVNDAPLFEIDITEVNVMYEDIEEEIVVNVIPLPIPTDEESQVVLYSVNSGENENFDVSVDELTGQVTFSNFAAIEESFEIEVVADDQQEKDNLASVDIKLNLSTVLASEKYFEYEMVIYPNPSNGAFVVNHPNNVSFDQIIVVDMFGRVVENVSISAISNQEIQIDMGVNQLGYFIVQFKSEGRSIANRRVLIN